MKSYPKYRASGIDWLGEIPEHWDVTRLRFLGRFTASGIDKKTVEGEPLVSMINYLDIYGNASRRITSEQKLMVVSCPEDKLATRRLPPSFGQFLV